MAPKKKPEVPAEKPIIGRFKSNLKVSVWGDSERRAHARARLRRRGLSAPPSAALLPIP
jgi:hypothetical protein